MPDTTVVQVAVPAPMDQTLDYLPPAEGRLPAPGARVRVPFGRRQVVGVVTGGSTRARIDGGRLKAITEILDSEPLIPDAVLKLGLWAAGYYHHPPGEVLTGMLPTPLRQGGRAARKPPEYWQLTADGHACDRDRLARRARRQAAVLARLAEQAEALPTAALADLEGDWRTALRKLAEQGLVERAAPSASPPTAAPTALNEDQQRAADAITDSLGSFSAHLLEGVTGSGKTEVYLAAMDAVLARGEQVLLLVPEIGLTPQLIERFSARVPGRIAVLHSALADGERQDAWLAAANGDVDVLIGTRSALFTPLPRAGLIIVDEEHDPSLKQQEGFRYNARDLAAVRARNGDFPLVLGSATPSLESLHNALAGRYRLLDLPRRAGAARPPRLELLDIRGQPLEAGVSRPVLARMDRHLADGGQVLLFLNRRGYAPVLLCHDCGWVASCTRCDARLTWHQHAGRLRCHHCGHERPVNRHCEDCGSTDLRDVGQGTEKLEKALADRFPDTGIVRIDRDSTRRKGAMTDLLDRARHGDGRILLGTQMLAKGHDLPDISLVAILDCDQGLFGADFRAPERMAQLITQVSGRAGRRDRPGEVLLQTHHPEHPLLDTLLREGYGRVARTMLQQRRDAALPPHTHMALVRAEAVESRAPHAFLEEVRHSGERLAGDDVLLMGPVPAPMERRAGRYRAQLLIQAPTRAPLHALLTRLVPGLTELPGARRVRWSVDVDPQDMF
ncbi:primosomal protein N' [Aquisalimonas asiatica]|uniref:Replication restart protein PriA n=1 Tax=Aquisalimonas asiatica TaxID=406100 RepID=A0A1H8TDF6_9GAMM|nr:primosomal protein N' [Aquisalimonas asiatica]SEO88766.1 replication restart DNA helicase PriA [Aquisalimonas asiatica]